jgi:hypothetical protein
MVSAELSIELCYPIPKNVLQYPQNIDFSSTTQRSLNCIADSWYEYRYHLYPHNACLYLQTCQLNSIANPGSGSLTAQKRTGNENTGFSFVGCTITGSGPIYLGRAWGPNSRVVFIYCTIADIITPAGWYDWGVSSRDK